MTNQDDSSVPEDYESRVVRTLTDMREERGWSQSELARRMVESGWTSYNQMTVSRTEKGERPIRLNEAAALARVFGVDLYNLWLPRQLRLYAMSTETVARLSQELRSLVVRYLAEQETLAIRADHNDLAEDEISHAAALLMETPERIVRLAREESRGQVVQWSQEVARDEGLKSDAERQAEERFWHGQHSLLTLLKELDSGKHQEEA